MQEEFLRLINSDLPPTSIDDAIDPSWSHNVYTLTLLAQSKSHSLLPQMLADDRVIDTAIEYGQIDVLLAYITESSIKKRKLWQIAQGYMSNSKIGKAMQDVMCSNLMIGDVNYNNAPISIIMLCCVRYLLVDCDEYKTDLSTEIVSLVEKCRTNQDDFLKGEVDSIVTWLRANKMDDTVKKLLA